MFKKSIPEKMTDIFLNYFSTNEEIIRSYGFFVYFTCRICKILKIFLNSGS